ncbi:MAG: lysophospholipid acyltransferase family protein, partial [Cyanobacteria bacterium P01_A01_bin.135]
MSTFDSSSSTADINSRVSPWLASLAYPLGCKLLLPAYFGQITVSGQQHLPTEGPVILAPTHKARWDALVVPYATGRYVTGRDLRYMVTADEVTGIQGWFIRRLGGFPINTRQPGIASLRYGMEVLQDGEMMVIFPEGGIFRDRELHPLKPGLARLAVQTELAQPGLGVKVVPMSLHYSERMPSQGCDVEVRIGQPLPVADYCQAAGQAAEET